MIEALLVAAIALGVAGLVVYRSGMHRRPASPVGRSLVFRQLVFPRAARFGIAQATAWFAALPPLLITEGLALTLELRGEGREVTLRLGVPAALEAGVRGQLAAWFPEARLEPLAPDAPNRVLSLLPLQLAQPDLYPLRVASERESDPLLGVLGVLAQQAEPCGLRLHLGPTPTDWPRWAPQALQALQAGKRLPPRGWLFGLWSVYHWFHMGAAPARGGIRPTMKTVAALAGMEAKVQAPVFGASVIVWAAGRSAAETGQRVRALAAQLQTSVREPFGNTFVTAGELRSVSVRDNPAALTTPQLTLSAAEVAALFHLPGTDAALLRREPSRRVAPPPRLLHPTATEQEPITRLGDALTSEGPVPFGLTQPERRLHTYIVGKTGTGKSTLLATILRQDLEAGHGVGLIDPHGDLAARVLALVPPERAGELLYFNPADTEFPVGYNLLSAAPPAQRPLIASGVISALKKLFAEFWGPRLEYILRNALLVLLETPHPSLLALTPLLTDRGYRQHVLSYVHDPILRHFFTEEWERYDPRWRAEALAPIMNKLGAFTSSPTLRHIVGQSRPGFSLRELMDTGGIFIANLAVGKIGEDAAALLGGLLVAGFHLAALSRADQAEADRRDFFLAVDEFQHLATESFAAILTESRKFGLALTLSHQFTSQIPEAMREAILGNAASLCVFRVGAPDAVRLVRELAPSFAVPDLVNLPNHEFAVRIVRGGAIQPAFSARTVALPDPPADISLLIERSRQQWARPRAAVEIEIADLWEGRLD